MGCYFNPLLEPKKRSSKKSKLLYYADACMFLKYSVQQIQCFGSDLDEFSRVHRGQMHFLSLPFFYFALRGF